LTDASDGANAHCVHCASLRQRTVLKYTLVCVRDISLWTQVIVPFQEGEKKMKEETDKAEADKRAKEVRFHQIRPQISLDSTTYSTDILAA